MTAGKLPPKPDPITGLPRPPAAPLRNTWGRGYRGPTDRATKPPVPPPGQGPALEWTSKPWNEFLFGITFLAILSIVTLTLRFGGLEWATHWVVWLVMIILSTLGTLWVIWAWSGLTAGADWVRYGREWVKTYELIEIKMGGSHAKNMLILKDKNGRDFSLSLLILQGIPDLWNLIYNGMLHSAYYGGAAVDELARQKLRLNPKLHLIQDENFRNEPGVGP